MDNKVDRRRVAAGDDAAVAARIRFFARLSLFEGVPEPALAAVAAAALPQSWPAGKLLFQRGDPSSYLLAVERGHIRISLQTRSGREFVLQHVRTAAIVGEIGVLDGAPRTADATAATATTGYVIDSRRYLELGARHPELARAAIRHLCTLVRRTTDHIETVALYGLKARLARFLLTASRQAGGGAPAARGSFVLDLNQSEIADYIGSSRPKVNRALAELEQAGAIGRSGKSITCDPELLMHAAAVSEDD